jgi:wyosine [tRNA(Phe)-imidazoG37] synthetase (radical SAM superfamily)
MPTQKVSDAYRRHDRNLLGHRFVYAVVSRRSEGVSVGINLNPDKACNFDCIYCQVDRTTPPVTRRVDLSGLAAELDAVLTAAADGRLYAAPPFDALPPEKRAIRDIAFSGDGEPTTCPEFVDAVQIAVAAKRRFGLDAAKLILITDAAYLTRPRVEDGLRLLDDNNGEIWAKLDAGTEEYYRLVNRPNVPLQTILDNILAAARIRPLVIQSLFMRVHDAPPPPQEIDAFCRRLHDILAGGGRLKLIQIYTIARRPAESYVTPLTDAEVDAIADIVRARIHVPVAAYYGTTG